MDTCKAPRSLLNLHSSLAAFHREAQQVPPMAFLVPQKPPSSSSSSSPSPSFGDENQGGNPVTSCLYLKPDAERRSLDRAVVLRRIRYRKRVNQFRAALMSFLKPKIAVEKDGDPDAWLHDAFSSP